MKARHLLGTMAALAALAAIGATACGGGDDVGSTLSADDIRTEKGIVSAAGVGFGGENLGTNEDSVLAGVPAPLIGADGGGIGDDLAAAVDAGAGLGIAPYPFLQADGSGTGITVQGYGTATADADSARVELTFGSFQDGVVPFPEPLPEPDFDDGGETSSGSTGSTTIEPLPPEFGFDDEFRMEEVEPITEADLQPVIDALVNGGVAWSDIEFVGQGYFDPYFASASLRVTVGSVDSIDTIVEAAENAAVQLVGIELQNSNVSYTVSDCSALQSAALETAIADAGDNGLLFAEALGVGLDDIIGATNFSYFPTDGSACDSYYGYYPVYEDVAFGGPEQAEVQAYAQVAMTYAIATP